MQTARPLPSLNALRAFEATARHLSFSRAAAELHVTPAALSHQLKGLEAYLGVKLFERRTRAIALTADGQRLYPGLSAAFAQIHQTLALLEPSKDDRILVVSAPPGFTAKFLAPRLYRFLMANPELDARISASHALANFTDDGVDVAIRNSTGPFPGLISVKLSEISVLPVASPRLVSEVGGLAHPQDLKHVKLIHDDMLGRLPGQPGWTEWLQAAGVNGLDLGRGVSFSSPDHALEAAVEGAGVLMAHKLLAHDDLRTGRLVAPFALEIVSARSFHLVYPRGSERKAKVRAFHDWILAEFARIEGAANSV